MVNHHRFLLLCDAVLAKASQPEMAELVWKWQRWPLFTRIHSNSGQVGCRLWKVSRWWWDGLQTWPWHQPRPISSKICCGTTWHQARPISSKIGCGTTCQRWRHPRESAKMCDMHGQASGGGFHPMRSPELLQALCAQMEGRQWALPYWQKGNNNCPAFDSPLTNVPDSDSAVNKW